MEGLGVVWGRVQLDSRVNIVFRPPNKRSDTDFIAFLSDRLHDHYYYTLLHTSTHIIFNHLRSPSELYSKPPIHKGFRVV